MDNNNSNFLCKNNINFYVSYFCRLIKYILKIISNFTLKLKYRYHKRKSKAVHKDIQKN